MNHIPVRTLDLSSTVLATHDDRVAAWHSVQAPLFQANLIEDRQRALDWRFQLHHLGVSICGQTRSSDQTIRRTASAIATGTCDHIFVDYLIDCEMAGEAGGKAFSAGSGDIVLFDMARPAVFDIAAPNLRLRGWRTAFMMIPRANFETHCDMRNLHGLVLQKDSPIGRIVGAHVRALACATVALSSPEAEAMGRGTAAFLAHALALASYRDPGDEEAFTDATLLRVRHFIANHFGRPTCHRTDCPRMRDFTGIALSSIRTVRRRRQLYPAAASVTDQTRAQRVVARTPNDLDRLPTQRVHR